MRLFAEDISLSKEKSLILKGIAIIAMLCHHLFTCVPKEIDIQFGAIPLYLGTIGKVCVSIFVLVSGYGIACGFNRIDNTTSFVNRLLHLISTLCKRFAHFYIQYWYIFLIFVPIGVLVFNRPLSVSYGENVNIIKRLCFDLLGIQGYHSYNETWWFNKLIILLYLFSPLFYFFVKKFFLPSLLFLLFFHELTSFLPISLYSMDYYSSSFFVGMALNVYNTKIKTVLSSHKKVAVCICICAVAVVMVLYRHKYFIFGGGRKYVIISAGLAILMMLLYIPKYISRPISFLGIHSGNIYLFHTFIYHRWFPSFYYSLKDPLIILLALLGTCLMASYAIECSKRLIGVTKFQIKIDSILSHLYVHPI